jgi:signal transduction histidine kinase
MGTTVPERKSRERICMETHEPEMTMHSSPAVPEIALPPLAPHGIAAPTLAEVAHEARNMVTMLGLYCELLDQPGVLTTAYRHYGSELKMVAAASRSLVERLGALEKADSRTDHALDAGSTLASVPKSAIDKPTTGRYWDELTLKPITNFAWELQSNRNLLAALAGPSIVVSVDAVGGALPVFLSSEDLTRILVNLIKNAIEATSSGGRIQLVLREIQTDAGDPSKLILNVEDSGSGIPVDALESVFTPGFSTHSNGSAGATERRGLGLSITRSIVEAAGGRMRAANRDPHGACIQIELPIRGI